VIFKNFLDTSLDYSTSQPSSEFAYVSDKGCHNPVETALCQHDDIVRLLVDLGAEYNVAVRRALG
jgi:hypothetical protein